MLNTEAINSGIRVIRGRDWTWGDQDGGDGMIGTVIDEGRDDGSLVQDQAVVIWDNGARGKYRAGRHALYDLYVLDMGTVGSKQGVSCDECQRDIIGIRWACMSCSLLSLCTSCYMAAAHDLTHPFERMDTGNTPPLQVPARAVSKRTEIRGNFPGALVVRGPHWEWDEQDGGEGQVGKVLDMENLQGKGKRNVARVQWMKTGVSNIYRIGHKGKVDIKCVQPAPYGACYKSHLPMLSCSLETSRMGQSSKLSSMESGVQMGSMPSTTLSFTDDNAGGIMEDADGMPVSSKLQHQIPPMCSMAFVNPLLGTGLAPGMVNTGGMTPGAVFPVMKPIAFNNMASDFKAGEKIRILESKERLIGLQENHGGFHPNMELDLGKIGTISHISETGDLAVTFDDNKSRWTINPIAASKVPTGLAEGDTVRLLSDPCLFKKIYVEDIGDWSDDYNKAIGLSAKITKTYLDGNFKVAVGYISMTISIRLIQEKVTQISADVAQAQEIGPGAASESPGSASSEKASIEGRLLRAAKEGDVEEVKEILQEHPLEINTPALDETPLLAAITEEREDIIEHLLNQGASVNIKDKNNHTAVHLALSMGHEKIIELVLKAKDLDIDVLDAKYKIDYLQFAAVCGSVRGAELLIRKFPGLLKRPSSGPTPVHFAVFSSKQLLEFFIKEAGLHVDSTDFDRRTPLHIALLSGNIDSCHLLVRLGSDINTKDAKGNTPLHTVMSSRGCKSLRDHKWYSIVMKRYLGRQREQKRINTTALQQMCDDLKFKSSKYESDMILGCWLIQEGADPLIRNANEKTAFQVCYRPDVLKIVQSFYDRFVQQKLKAFEDQLPSLTSISSDAQDCRLCRSSEPCMKFLPCEHIITCQNCAEYFKKCYICDVIIEGLTNTNDIADCLICEVGPAEVLFEPCGHTVVCLACSWRMKRCIYCKALIDVMKKKDGSLIEEKVNKEDSKYASLLETLKTLETKVKDMESQNTCSVCLDRPKNVVFLCGHGTCTMCSTTLGQCPICRSSIDKKIVLFQ